MSVREKDYIGLCMSLSFQRLKELQQYETGRKFGENI